MSPLAYNTRGNDDAPYKLRSSLSTHYFSLHKQVSIGSYVATMYTGVKDIRSMVAQDFPVQHWQPCDVTPIISAIDSLSPSKKRINRY